MLDRLDNNSNLVAISSDYAPTVPEIYDSYSDEVICANERWHTWFCIYKREALQCQVSHAYYEEIVSGPVRRNAWDDAGYFQKSLKESYGFELAALDSKYQPCFIHYGQFAKNVEIDESNVALYRTLQIIRKRGLFGTGDVFTRKLVGFLHKILFVKADKNRSKYVDDWAKETSS